MGRSIATVVVSMVLLTYLLVESRTPERARMARMQEALQSIQLHDAELNRNVLMARAGLLSNYDSLPRLGKDLLRDVETLRSESAELRPDGARMIGPEVAALGDAVQTKLTVVEYLKSDNALLRNSMAYFAQSLQTTNRTETAALQIAALARAMVRFVQMPEPAIRAESLTTLDRISTLPIPQQHLKTLTEHARLILDVLPQVDALLRDIASSPTAQHAEALQQAMLAYGGRVEGRAQRFRLILYLVALALLAYLVRLGAMLRAKARELHRKDIQLIQANKMTSLGTLVSGVVHEINNPNQVVLLNAQTVASGWDDAVAILDSEERRRGEFSIGGLPYNEMRTTMAQLIREVRDSARRIERIMGDLKDFARPRVSVTELFQLNDVVQRALRLLGHLIRKRAESIQVHLDAGLPLMKGNPQQIEQVIVNLIVNAVEAFGDRKGIVTVSTWSDAAKGCVTMEIKDDGIGIPSEHIPHLCEPFFTTKENTGGTGLGLAITSALVRSHNGRLAVMSEPSKGTRVVVEFPRPEGLGSGLERSA